MLPAPVFLLAGQKQAGPEGEMAVPLHISYFSHDNAPDGSDLREEGFILTQRFRGSQSLVPGKACGGSGSVPAGRSMGPLGILK